MLILTLLDPVNPLKEENNNLTSVQPTKMYLLVKNTKRPINNTYLTI